MSKAADLYSFGVILWELYHGISAWQVRKSNVEAEWISLPSKDVKITSMSQYSFCLIFLGHTLKALK